MTEDKKISLIIPLLNEEKVINNLLNNLRQDESVEVIFVDGGSQDNTVNIIQQFGFQVIISPVARRSYQMNLGAQKATGDILFFLHSDTIPPANFPQIIRDTMSQPNFVAGAFRLRIDNHKPIFRLLEIFIKWRSQLLSLPYGDQGIFLSKKQFAQINGFDDLFIMEDFVFIQKLQKKGKIYLASEAVTTSARRWEKLGLFQTTMINQMIIIGYYLGVNNHKLANIYRQIKQRK